MSFVESQIHRIDAAFDKVELAGSEPAAEGQPSVRILDDPEIDKRRVEKLLSLIRSVSPISSPQDLTSSDVAARRLLHTLDQAEISSSCATCTSLFTEQGQIRGVRRDSTHYTYQHDLEWLLVSKVAIQTYGLLLNELLERATALSDHIYYWDDVLSSYTSIGLYYVQTAPIRLWELSNRALRSSRNVRRGQTVTGWVRYWDIVKDSVTKNVFVSNSVDDLRKRVMDPLARTRYEAMQKRAILQKRKDVFGSAIGALLADGFINDVLYQRGSATDYPLNWKSTVTTTVALVDAVVHKLTETGIEPYEFLQSVYDETHVDQYFQLVAQGEEVIALTVPPSDVVERIQDVLRVGLPSFESISAQSMKIHGRPSRLVRYWLPATALLMSSTTILRIITNRKAELMTWIRELGATIIDFWSNWVVEPTKKIIGTIRHDESSEVSIMSRRSLEADRASLERMVVDFAVDNPEGPRLTESDIETVRAKVREGDLTPVLKAYEEDLKHPYRRAVWGNLIRELLIQIQKTKVDVEVAMGGIDSLLKSQQLVFGLAGLTPGILITFAALRGIQRSISNRRGLRRGRKKGYILRLLRNIDRILTSATVERDNDGDEATEYLGRISYKDQGLLLCEINVLRQSANKVMPNETFREFAADVDELADIRIGVVRQQRVADRLRWAYSKWF